jgi:hypothetical protein
MTNSAEPTAFDFSRLLRRGRGLAILRAAEVPRAQQHEALLDACTHFTAYDIQGEGVRAEYLFDALEAAGARSTLEAPILASLATDDFRDRAQTLELAYLFALDGSAAAEQALQDTFLRCVEERDRHGASQVVRACGLPGFLLVARELGRVLGNEGAEWEEARALNDAEACHGVELAQATLRQAAAHDAYVRRYREAVLAYREQWARYERGPRVPLPFALTFEGLREAALDPKLLDRRARGSVRRWGKEAPHTELARAAEALRARPPPALLLSILRAFAARTFAAPPGPLLDATRSARPEVADAAWKALARVRSDEVRAFARAALGEPKPELRALQGLQQDLRSEDVELVAGVLSGIADDEDFHFAELVLGDALGVRGAPYFAPLLLQMYEGGNCGLCRHAHVKWMHTLRVAPASVLAECRRDAYLELRADAAAWSRGASSVG